MMTYEDALQIIFQSSRPLSPKEVPLEEALGRVLAAPACSRWDLPPADNSAMDGYAFRFSGQSAGDELNVINFLPAGRVLTLEVPPGHAVKIMTGAPIPPGCDTVVPIEDVLASKGKIRLTRPPVPKSHVRYRGEEIQLGEVLVEPGTVIHAGETAVLAAGGAARVRICPRPHVAVLATGDELVDLGTKPGPGQIVNSNIHFLASRLREEGCKVTSLGIATDDVEDLARRIERGVEEADMLITTGGVSAGDRDLVQEVLQKKGFNLGFWKVAIKPGKPVLFGSLRGKPVFGLPGNPGATAVTFELFVRPALKILSGVNNPFSPRLKAVLTERVRGDAKRQLFTWGALEEADGKYLFKPAERQNSGHHRSFQGAMALMPIPSGAKGLPAGSEVSVIVLRLPFSGDCPGEVFRRPLALNE